MLSEEEIITRIKHLIYTLIEERKHSRVDIEQIKIQEAIEGLLDLYNKEKEKNKTLETLLQGNLYQMYSYYKELASRYQANSISKDKIKEKMKKVKELSTAGYEILKQLLEE